MPDSMLHAHAFLRLKTLKINIKPLFNANKKFSYHTSAVITPFKVTFTFTFVEDSRSCPALRPQSILAKRTDSRLPILILSESPYKTSY